MTTSSRYRMAEIVMRSPVLMSANFPSNVLAMLGENAGE